MNKLAPVFIIAAAILWGVDGIILRPTLYSLPVPTVVFIESLIVSIYLSPILIKKGDILKSLKFSDWINFMGVALFGGVLGIMGITKALFYVNYVNLSIVILIQKLQPVFAITFAVIILKEKLNPKFIIWASIALVGAYIMTFGFKTPLVNSEDKTLYAALYALLAAFSFGLSTVLSKRILFNVGFKLATYIRFLLSTFLMLIVIASLGNFQSITEITSSQFLTFLLIAFTTGGPAMFLYYYGLKFTSASSSTVLELAFPLTAILLEYFVRGNILGLAQWIGVVILLVGITNVANLNRS